MHTSKTSVSICVHRCSSAESLSGGFLRTLREALRVRGFAIVTGTQDCDPLTALRASTKQRPEGNFKAFQEGVRFLKNDFYRSFKFIRTYVKIAKKLDFLTAKMPRTPRIYRACVSPIYVKRNLS
jgi:hypothetical protein